MSLFSPISNRSLKTRGLYLAVYLLLTIGAISMVQPLLITLTGAMSGPYEASAFSLYPRFLFNDSALWRRFVEAKYGGVIDIYKMAWGSENLDFYEDPPVPEPAEKEVALWAAFLQERGPLSTQFAGLAFTRGSNQHAALENVRFRNWLLARYGGDLKRLNEEMAGDFASASGIVPPAQNRLVLLDADTPYAKVFFEYVAGIGNAHRLCWNVGNFYRAVFLPRIFGGKIASYNEEFGTDYRSFAEVPFASQAEGNQAWFRFLKQVLNPAFIEFTEAGKAAFEASGMNKVDFIKSRAEAGHMRVVSIDTEFADWAKAKGIEDARIPQAQLDWDDFQKEKGFWRWQFATQNFAQVIDEAVVQSNGLRNTFLLVVLSVGGALTVNPMAAYALSRFRLKQSYQVLLFFLATIAFPGEVAMIPNFLQIKELGMINTFWALTIPGLVNGFSIFLLKGFFDSLPRELYEAADIDGASEWQVFWGITMNLSKPILAVIALGAFTSAYGAFMFAMILAPNPEMWTLMVWIYQLQQSAGSGIVYASVLITALPLLVIYICTQNVIMRGIIVPSEK